MLTRHPSVRHKLARSPLRKIFFAAGIMVIAAGIGTARGAAQTVSAQSIRALDRGSDYFNTAAAADFATESVLDQMYSDFVLGGGSYVSKRLNYYQSLPLSPFSTDPYWTNFAFTMPPSGGPGTWVGLVTNSPFTALAGLQPGLNGYQSIYRVASVARLSSPPSSAGVAVWQDVALETVPVFEYAIFYNGLLEFSDTAPLVINGPVHGNGDIYFGTILNSSLTFNSFVSASGTFTNPAAVGFAQSNWTGPLTLNGLPFPCVAIHQPILNLPVGTNNPAALREIINPPPLGEATTSPISSQRYYNQAFMVITVTNPVAGTGTNAVTSTNYSVWISIKNSMYDPTPTNIFLGTNINHGPNVTWATTGVSNWLSTNLTFFDQREARTNHVTQIDLKQLGYWIGLNNVTGGATNTLCNGKWNGATPFNGIIYVQDSRLTNSAYMDCVRLVNGQAITNGLYSSGLTLATQNPLYIAGLYNCPASTNLGTTNTTGWVRPCSVVCDALTILSPNWLADNYDSSSALTYGLRPAASDTVNAAIIAGNIPSTGSTVTTFSGGVNNLPRMLEDWTGQTLMLNTSLVNLYNSVQAAHQFQLPGAYYAPPARLFSFDLNFLNPTKLPPGTPQLMLVERLRRITADPAADPSQ